MDNRQLIELVWPAPKSIAIGGGVCRLPQRAQLAVHGPPEILAAAELFARRVSRADSLVRVGVGATGAITLVLDPERVTQASGYRLVLRDPTGIAIVARDASGARAGLATLAQILDLCPRESLPALECHDWPDFAVRGAMLDVSRGRAPTMETLRALVERMAALKLNQLQLYMEHVFAYRDHETVWRDASPFTAGEILELDAYCAARGVELVPNQQSFGHMHRWVKHARYRDLAEVPAGVEHAFSLDREPYSLNLGDPRALALLDELYGELLPNFGSTSFNVGLDETFDLGLGASKAACAERGVERVYLEYLRKVRAIVQRHERRMQFWGDVILQRPELVPELPKDLVALEWGYEDGHPFAAHVEHFRASGLEFYVCPGTSSWQSFAGRTRNMLANVNSATRHGLRAGASGCLVTDWGDRGHHQPHFVREAGLVAALGLAWNAMSAETLDEERLARLLDRHVFRDEAEVLGRAAVDLGNAYLETGSAATNGSALFFLVAFAPESFPHARTPGLNFGGLIRAKEHVERIAARLASARSTRDDARTIADEMTWACDALRLSADLGLARLAAGANSPLRALPPPARADLDARFDALTRAQTDLWLRRDRSGGLPESLRWFDRVRRELA